MMPNKIFIGVKASGASISNLARFTKSIVWQDAPSADITLLLGADAAFDRAAYLEAVHRSLAERPDVAVRFVENDPNPWAGHAHNILGGHAASVGDGLYIGADPDGIFHHGAIAMLIRASEKRPPNTLFEFMRFPEERPKIYDQDSWETAWCARSSFAIAARFFVAAGGFDENLTACEDVDLSWRIRLSGGLCVLVPTALFYQAAPSTEACAESQVERLTSGRYLASKWHHPTFLNAVEAQMTSGGVPFEDRHLARENAFLQQYRSEDIERVCDFSHGFHFSPTRW